MAHAALTGRNRRLPECRLSPASGTPIFLGLRPSVRRRVAYYPVVVSTPALSPACNLSAQKPTKNCCPGSTKQRAMAVWSDAIPGDRRRRLASLIASIVTAVNGLVLETQSDDASPAWLAWGHPQACSLRREPGPAMELQVEDELYIEEIKMCLIKTTSGWRVSPQEWVTVSKR